MSDLPRDEAMEELLRHREWAVGLARRLLRDRDGADDAVQQAMLAALEHPPARLDTPRSWLGTVVRSWVARGERSRGRRERHERTVARPETDDATEDVVERADLQRFLANALLDLGEPYRRTLLLRYFDGLSLREVADRTGVGLETVRTRIRRGLERLRKRLQDRAGDRGTDWRGPLALLVARSPQPAASEGLDGGRTGSRRLARTSAVAAALAVAVLVGVAVSTGSASARTDAGDVARASLAAHRPGANRAARAQISSADAAAEALVDTGREAGDAIADRAVPVRSPAGEFGAPAPWTDPSSTVTSLAFTPDGGVLAAGASDGTVKLRAVPSGEVLRTLAGHRDQVTCVAVSGDGVLVVSGSLDQTVRVWDRLRGTEVRVFREHAVAVREVVCAPTGIAASSDVSGTVLVWRLADGAVLERLCIPSSNDYARSLSFTPDGRCLAAAARTYDGVATWTLPVAGPAAVLRPSEGVGRVCRIEADGTSVWTASSQGLVRATIAGDVTRRVTVDAGEVTALEIVPGDGTVLAGTREGAVHAFGPAGAAPLWTTRLRERGVMALAVRADGTLAASACSSGRISLLDPRTGATVATDDPARAGHDWTVSSLAVDPCGRFVASGSWDGSVKLWDLASREVRHTLLGHGSWVIAVDVSPCGRFVASASHDRTVRIWDAGTGAAVRTLEGHEDIVGAVRFAPEGRLVLSGSQDRTAVLWDLESGARVRTFEGHTDEVRSVAFLAEGRVATASEDGTLRVWSRATGETLRVLEGHSDRVTSVVASAGGTRLVSGAHDGAVRVWDASTGECLRTIASRAGWIHEVAVSPDGRHVVAAGRDAALRRWDLLSGRPLDVLAGHTVGADAIAFLPDGRTLLSGGWDKRILVWDAPDDR